MVKSVQYNGSTTNTADSLFGNTPLFSTTPTKLSSTAQSLFNLEPTKPVELSPAAQSALKEMDAIQAQAEKAGERVAQIQAERMKQQEALSKQLEAQREELVRQAEERARQAEARKKAEEKAAEELKEKIKSDPPMLVKADIDALLSSEAYQKAGDLRRQAMMAQKSAEIRQRLIAQGVSPEAAEASARTFESSIQSDINRFKQDAEDGWFSPVKDFFKRSAQQFNDWQSAGNIKDAGLITEAQSDLLSRGKARGWAVDEALERDPEIRNFLIRDGAIDSLSEFRLKPGLTAAQKSELKTRLENTYQGVYSDFEKNNKEATDWRASMSAEQRREMDNFSFESEQMSAKYDPNDDSLLTSLSKTWDSVTLAARYPTTLLTDNSGSLAVAAGTTVVNLGLTAASAVPGLNAGTVPAAAAGWARTAQTVRKLGTVLFSSVGNAELTEADVINSAREQIAASSVADLAKANPEQWAAMLKLTDGNEELAKQKLVTMTATDNWASAWVLGFATGVAGPEALISSAISRGAAKRIALGRIEGIAAQSTAQITSRNVAKNAALWSVGTLSEGAEEGFTTYFTNLATRNANGTQDLWDGFEESLGTGLAMGGMVSSVATALNTVQTVRSETELRDRAVAVAPLSDANIRAKTEQYMELGNVDFNTLRKTMMDDLTSFASNVSHAFARSPEAISAQQQMYFDTFIDNANVLERLPSSQQRELKNLAKEAFDGDVNINGYDRAQNTAAMQVLADSTQRPADPVLADAWRVIHSKELKQVAEPKLAEATAKLYKQLFPNGEANETTRQRVNRTTQILRDIVNDDPSITASDKRTLLQRANVYFDASTRRAGDPNANEETKQSPQGTDSSNNGGGVQQGEPSRQGQQAEATDAGQATADSQGTRDGATRQAGEQAGGATATAGASADAQSDVARTREAPQTEPPTYTSGEIDVPSATPTIPGSDGQTNQTSGPDGLAVTTPTPTAESGGVVGTPPTERSADGSSTTTTTTSDTLGGNDGRETTTQSGTSYDNRPFSTEVRNLDTAYTTVRTRAIAEGSAPAFKRKSVRRRISEDTQIDVPSPRLVSRQAQQDTTNETQDTTSEQPTDARAATTEESADTPRDVRETDDQTGAVRGQSEEANRTAQEEPSNQVETMEVSNEPPDTVTQRDDTNVSSPNQQTEPTTSNVGADTGNIRQLTAADIESATTADDAIATGTVPVANNGPVTLGDTPTEQVAIVQPLIVRGTTVDTAYTNEGQHTPAEESAQAVFDTHPITDTAEDGTTVAEIAVALADNFGVNSTELMTPPKKLSSKKKGKLRQAVVEKFKRPETERSDRLFTNETALANAVHNQLFKTVQEGESNQAQWLEYLVANDFEGHLAEAINSVEYLQAGIDAAMSNSSVATARAPITDYWRWDKRSSDPKYKDKKYFSVEGAAQKVASHLAGITPRFDDYLNGMENVPRSGMAQDSAKPSVSLAKISSMKNAIYGFIHTTYIDPVIKLIEDKTFKYPKNKDIGTDMGRYAKYRHTLEEYGDSWLKGKNDEVAELRNKIAENETAILDIVNDIVGNLTIEDILANEDSIRSTASSLSEVSRRKFNASVKEHAQLTRELTKAEKDATNSADVWFGRVSREDFPNMKLPDGHTKAELEALIAELEATYDKADLEEVADKIYGAYAGIRTTGATYGVYDSVQLKSFNDIKYKKYVHMGRGHRDKPSEFEEDVINESLFDGVDDVNLVEQYKTLGLTRDLSKYKRAGSTSEVDDALANLGRLARNVAGRAASVEFEQDIQGLFEGTLNQPVLEGKPTTEQITEFKTAIVQKGAVAGLVRIRSDLPSLLVPSEFKHITPVLGKGWELNEKTGEYELVPYKYYFTDPVIQNELTHNVDVNNNWNTNVVTANIRTLTRLSASLMTSRKPMWNIWNFYREFKERGSTIMFRPVVDDAGKRVSGIKLASLFAKNLSRMSVDLDLQAEIYRYLAFREMRTPAQRELHNLYTSGTIQVMTDLTDKYDFMGEQDRSALDNAANHAQKLMKRLGSKSGLTNMVNVTAEQAIKWYNIRVTEVPQVVNAMAMHRAYRDAGVNMAEANHRVRDSFDPARTKSTIVQTLSNYLPFIRSTGAGNYNTMRTLGDAFLRGSRADRAKAVLKLTLLCLRAYATVQLASAAFGDDEDGEDLIAQFDQGELNRGVPVRLSDGTVIFLPVAHGLLSMIWSFATSMHRLVNGRTDGWGVAGNVVEQFVKNSLPANAPTGDQVANSGGKAVFLNLMPTMFLPAAEVILNQTQFGSNEIVHNSTPSGERDSDQDNFNTPEVYKDMAKGIYKMTGGMVDWRPENIHHVVRSYAGVGPFRSIDASLQDKGEKTAGVFANKGERMGVFAALVGADIGISTSVMSNESRYYSLAEHKPKILRKYNVPETMTDGDTYDKVDLTGIDTSGINFDRETSAERFAHQLRAAGATDAEVQLVVNLTLADSKRKELQKEMRKVGRSVYNSTRRGTATEYTEADVFEAATALNQLYYDTVINNNQFTQRVK